MKNQLLIVSLIFIASVIFAQSSAIKEHQEITGPFNKPQDVTKKCLECHAEVGDEILASRHWNWEEAHGNVPEGKVNLGKKNLINNFCSAFVSAHL